MERMFGIIMLIMAAVSTSREMKGMMGKIPMLATYERSHRGTPQHGR